MSSRLTARWVVTVGCCIATALSLPGCSAPSPRVAAKAGCLQNGGLSACEKALLTADVRDLDGLIGQYAHATGAVAWRELWQILKAASGDAVVVHSGDHPPNAAWPHHQVLVSSDEPRSVPAAHLLIRLAQAAKVEHLIRVGSEKAWQSFPKDRLSFAVPGLESVISADPRHIESDIELARHARVALSAAGRFDYVAASRTMGKARTLLRSERGSEGARRRVAYAQLLLHKAGVIAVPEQEAALPPVGEPPDKPSSHAYEAWLNIQLAGSHRASHWKTQGATIKAQLDPIRRQLLDRLYAGERSCPVMALPPMDRIGDLVFASLVGPALDVDAGPDQEPAVGKLSLLPWRQRYRSLLKLVDLSSAFWLHAPDLLQQRGELQGFSARESTSYEMVSSQSKRHIEALAQLASTHPKEFPIFPAVKLAYQPGLLGEPALRRKVAELIFGVVDKSIGEAESVEGLYDAGLAAIGAVMASPSELQREQLNALKRSLAAKIAEDFGDRRGWRIAGLGLAEGLLASLTGVEVAYAEVAQKIARSLGSADRLEYGGVARVITAISRYVALFDGKVLDATVANPAMFTAERRQARAALREAIRSLTERGPVSEPEKELLRRTTNFADGLIVVLSAYLTEETSAPRCPNKGGVLPKELRDSVDRLHKVRRELLASRGFSEGRPGPWSRRVRFMATLMSDGLDVLDRKPGNIQFAISPEQAEASSTLALKSWLDPAAFELSHGLYTGVRAGLERRASRLSTVDIARAIRGLAQTFAGEKLPWFDDFVRATTAKSSGEHSPSTVMFALASQAYVGDGFELGDVLSLVGASIASTQDDDRLATAVSTAQRHQRPIVLPLRLRDDAQRVAPKQMATDMRQAIAKSCTKPSAKAVIAVHETLHELRNGQTRKALTRLDRILSTALVQGLSVPRQTFTFRHRMGGRALELHHSVSFGIPLLKGASSFRLGVGVQARTDSGTDLKSSFADPRSSKSLRESGRYYAHLSCLSALVHGVMGDKGKAVKAARQAVSTWVHGVRLGGHGIAADTVAWAADALPTIVLTAQLMAENGEALLAGDLWTLARAALGTDADDKTIATTVAPLPSYLSGIPHVEKLAIRATKSLRAATSDFACTRTRETPKRLLRTGCRSYPLALSLRAAEGLAQLPYLRRGAEAKRSDCGGWRALDRYFTARETQAYDPDKFVSAVTQLRRDGRIQDAAVLMTRQRHRNHCSPRLQNIAQELARHAALGVHIRADLLSVVVNCQGGTVSPTIVATLDDLARQHATPARSLELLVFAARRAQKAGDYGALLALTTKADMLRHWYGYGPGLGTVALLLHHIALIGGDSPFKPDGTEAYYRMLCTSFAPQQREPLCAVLRRLRSSTEAREKKVIAKRALTEFVRQALRKSTPKP